MSRADTLRDRDGNAVETDRIYARHPLRKAFPTIVLAAETFHSHMISDQMADIARFLKAHVRLRTLRITVSSATGAKLNGTVTASGLDAGIRAYANASLYHELVQLEEDPVIVPYEFEPYWIDEFPDVRAAITRSSKGSMTRVIHKDTSYGLTASVAAQAGIKSDSICRRRICHHTLKVEASRLRLICLRATAVERHLCCPALK